MAIPEIQPIQVQEVKREGVIDNQEAPKQISNQTLVDSSNIGDLAYSLGISTGAARSSSENSGRSQTSFFAQFDRMARQGTDKLIDLAKSGLAWNHAGAVQSLA